MFYYFKRNVIKILLQKWFYKFLSWDCFREMKIGILAAILKR